MVAPRKYTRNGPFKQTEMRKPDWYPEKAVAEDTVVHMLKKFGRFNYNQNAVTEAVKKNLVQNNIELPPSMWFWQRSEIDYEDGWYKGDAVDIEGKQIRQGRGIMIWNNGSIYEGTWNEDKMEGVGRIIHPEFLYYEGLWRNGKANGYGKCSEEGDDHHYEGEFLDDLKHGSGKEQWKDKTYYYEG